MRIAVDVRELSGKPTGVGRYLGALLQEWSTSRDAHRHEWLLFSHAKPPVPEFFAPHVRVLEGNGGTPWQQWTFARALTTEKPDLVFAPGYTAPLTAPAPSVVTIHDVSYFDHPDWFATREGQRLRWLTKWSARRARLVLTDSEFSRQQILHHLRLPPDRVRVIPLGIHESHLRGHDSREPVILYVGSLFERRHVDWLIEGFDAVADRVPGARLEIVGENRTRNPRRDFEALRERCRHKDQIALRSYVDEATLSGLYRRASLFAFLSEYEGFGFTPLEALAAGVPPLVLDTPIAREVCGRAAHYIDKGAVASELSNTLVTLLTDQSQRRAILEQAPATLARYCWPDTAAATLTALEEAARG